MKDTTNAYYTLFIGKDCQYYFNLIAGNHEPILRSTEGYTTKQNALKGIKSVQKNCENNDRYERKTAKDASPYFVLKARNGEPIGVSEMYSSKQMMENGINSVKKNGVTEKINEIESKCITIYLNDDSYTIKEGSMSGSDILELGKFSSSEYSLFLLQGSEQTEIHANDTVSLIDGMKFQVIVSNIQFG